jgi:Rha family phage regulatory protein
MNKDKIVTLHKKKATTTSLIVAEKFNKLHKDVLKAIRNLECSDEFRERNFALCFKNNELQNGKPNPYYEMTRDGFSRPFDN